MIIYVPKNAIKHRFKWQSVYTTLSPNPRSVILSDKHCANIYQTEEIHHVRFETWYRLGRTDCTAIYYPPLPPALLRPRPNVISDRAVLWLSHHPFQLQLEVEEGRGTGRAGQPPSRARLLLLQASCEATALGMGGFEIWLENWFRHKML